MKIRTCWICSALTLFCIIECRVQNMAAAWPVGCSFTSIARLFQLLWISFGINMTCFYRYDLSSVHSPSLYAEANTNVRIFDFNLYTLSIIHHLPFMSPTQLRSVTVKKSLQYRETEVVAETELHIMINNSQLRQILKILLKITGSSPKNCCQPLFFAFYVMKEEIQRLNRHSKNTLKELDK